jgi:hypothetical protein
VTRHQRLQKNMRNPGRQKRRHRNRAHRIFRRKAQEEFASWMQDRLRAQQIIEHELWGLRINRPQAIVSMPAL